MTRFNNYANRGEALEQAIEIANNRYNSLGVAKIDKVPTPVKVLEQNGNKIKEAFFEKKSIVDFVGSYKGKSIAFDAKSTNVETRFDLNNIAKHQYEYLEDHHRTDGISFILVHFKTLDKYYVVTFPILREYWNGRTASIPYNSLKQKCYKIDILNYLDFLGGM